MVQKQASVKMVGEVDPESRGSLRHLVVASTLRHFSVTGTTLSSLSLLQVDIGGIHAQDAWQSHQSTIQPFSSLIGIDGFWGGIFLDMNKTPVQVDGQGVFREVCVIHPIAFHPFAFGPFRQNLQVLSQAVGKVRRGLNLALGNPRPFGEHLKLEELALDGPIPECALAVRTQAEVEPELRRWCEDGCMPSFE